MKKNYKIAFILPEISGTVAAVGYRGKMFYLSDLF